VNVVPDACFTLHVLNTWCDNCINGSDVNERCTILQIKLHHLVDPARLSEQVNASESASF
jgi:hypothetical protein